MTYPIAVTVNNVRYSTVVEAGQTLLRLIREDLGLAGTKEGCDDSECGACMVLVDGRPVNSCCFLALQAADRSVTTIEGLSRENELHPLQEAILLAGGVQCGYCTPGMLMSAKALLDAEPHPSDSQVRRAIAGNLCRCTGYARIVDAILAASADARTEHS